MCAVLLSLALDILETQYTKANVDILYILQNSKAAQGLVGLKNLGNTVSTTSFYFVMVTVFLETTRLYIWISNLKKGSCEIHSIFNNV